MLDLSDVTFPAAVVWGNPQRKAWLYVFVCGDFVKVGMATLPINRLATVAGAMPFDVSIWGAYRVPYDVARLAESFCHCKLAQNHHRGEWFRMEPAPALALVKEVAGLASRAFGERTAKLDIGRFQGVPVKLAAPRTKMFRETIGTLFGHSPKNTQKRA